MRSIRFRAWNTIAKEMVYSANSDIKIYLNGSISQHGKWVSPSDCILMQYTSLKDKDGKGIYEGDIIDAGGFVTYIVKYQEKFMRFVLDLKDIYGEWFRELGLSPEEDNEREHWKVIGNIYENPELIK
jgi:uncharacterized phage protein (TIGR01671 family)